MQRGEDSTKVYVFADTTQSHTCAISPAVTQHMQQRQQHKLMANRRREGT